MTVAIPIQRLSSQDANFKPKLLASLSLPMADDAAIDAAVVNILKQVQSEGDIAILNFTKQFDRLNVNSVAELEISKKDLEQAYLQLSPEQKSALDIAAQRVRTYHEQQRKEAGCHSWEYTEKDGTRLGQKVTPLDRVGIYVPGGKAAYPSSVLMNAIPAKVAGVQEVIMVVPTPDGARNSLVLAAAWIAGVDRVFTIGGAQAVAALAYGTKTIPSVDKIVGPGNAYVAAAKRRVFGTVGIDMIAGPSEILILCDGTIDPDWIAMDLFSQAEHDELAQSILLCPDATFIEKVQASINKLLPEMPRKQVIETSLKNRALLIQVKDMNEACDIANAIAAEHLEICAANPRQWAEKIRHAGAIFMGNYTSESLGDYCAGPNHVLPTARTARFSSPLGVYDFIKRSSMIEVSEAGAQTLGQVASTLAHGEGLQAHARAAEMRLKK
ncbi:histidinol dehydrogenase [Polynucleobacter paneuropaeus]|uniref:Histidinol dehydrogenase n=1 Tax=Polynucleobacter paneuropaeus TaxID=2527775 RepID=A0ABX9FFJ6_9BURK|nr:histidinol dehydrogenase [Polynucleobacter paneuropaeus]MBT8621666.1 histidinol dehydrogenase [Polynucleobacter paneuropaeus]QWD18153.1 histidinol dehydrogenase [Polynucleobacter paneuropaeus]RAZ43744.1 histidinol dehydrogenase [Polynucleobacter paneuropaeus]